MERQDWRSAWDFGYEANRHLFLIQQTAFKQEDEADGCWVCEKCDRFVLDGYLCKCTKMNADDLRYHKNKEDGKFIFGQ